MSNNPRVLYLGIDNGASGGIAALREDGTIYRVDATPPTDAEVLHLLIVLHAPQDAFAILEHAQAFPKMGTSSAFNYGRGYGAMQMALHAAGIPFDIVVPRKWQAAMSCLSGGDKNITKRRAQQLFPGVTVTHAIADALLMAEYCRRLKRGSLNLPAKRGSNGEEKQGEETRKTTRQVGPGAAEEKGPGDVPRQQLTFKGGHRAGKGAALAESARDGAGARRAPRHDL